MFDMKQLEYHASVSNKIPIFLVQFLKQDRIYAIIPIEEIPYISSCLKTDGKQVQQHQVEKLEVEESEVIKRTVKASKKARDQFFKERSETFGKRKRN